jgi:ribosomal protein L37AE/L43A
LLAPEWSEYLDDRHIRHLWSCDTCGYEFETTVRYPEPAAQAA